MIQQDPGRGGGESVKVSASVSSDEKGGIRDGQSLTEAWVGEIWGRCDVLLQFIELGRMIV